MGVQTSYWETVEEAVSVVWVVGDGGGRSNAVWGTLNLRRLWDIPVEMCVGPKLWNIMDVEVATGSLGVDRALIRE